MSCGIYAIIVTDMQGECRFVYVGQSVDMATRWRDHRAGRSHNDVMAVMMKTHESIKFVVLEECEIHMLDHREVDWYNILSRSHRMYNDPSGLRGHVDHKEKRVEEFKALRTYLEPEIKTHRERKPAGPFATKEELRAYIKRGERR